MLRKEIRIEPADVIVGTELKVVTRLDGMVQSKKGRVTRITGDSLYRYFWVGDRVLGVEAKSVDHPTLLEQEFYTFQDVRDEELQAVYLALGAAIRKQADYSDVARDFLDELEARGYEVRAIKRSLPLRPTVKAEVEVKRPAA